MMRQSPSNAELAAASPQPKMEAKKQAGSQTLLRGLDVIDAVVEGPITLAQLAERLGLNRSTTHRLASALIERRYLTFVPRLGYRIGPKLLALGHLAQQQIDIVQIAKPHLETLAAATEDTVHLGVLDSEHALYLAKIPGRRRVDISSRVGERHPLSSTGLGKALLLDDDETHWRSIFDEDQTAGSPVAEYESWRERMRGYVRAGRSFDLQENEDMIRCVAAPVRDASGRIVAALSVSSAAQYMGDARMEALTTDVLDTAAAISADLGFSQ
jgi:DNA-binding IclR family transcriptional regulator